MARPFPWSDDVYYRFEATKNEPSSRHQQKAVAMKLMMQPGSALLVLATVAFAARFVAGSIPVIGGLLSFILLFAVVFGVVGGVYLLFLGRRQAA